MGITHSSVGGKLTQAKFESATSHTISGTITLPITGIALIGEGEKYLRVKPSSETWGDAALSYGIGFARTWTDPTQETVGIRSHTRFTAIAGVNTQYVASISADFIIPNSNTQNWTNVAGANSPEALDDTFQIDNGATGTITAAVNHFINLSHEAAGLTITNWYGEYIVDPRGAGPVTNAYGIYIEDITRGGTLNRALYCGGPAQFKKDAYFDYPVYFSNTIDLSGNFFQAGEIADPGAPAANKARVYVRDNGAGKTQFVALFPTGVVQVIATEP